MGRDLCLRHLTWSAAPAERQLDRGLLPGVRPALATLNIKDFADHEGLRVVGC
jgi:hypothetical protein